ncbi:MAG: GyrI-like domain-containing protein [Bacteroidetes bacterium]|nr:GyrI-like domain-containing protein [Bacteroidota bacterium]
MNPEIRTLTEKNLVGIRLKMSLEDNRTFELWKSFMPRLKEIINNIGDELFSMQIYNQLYFENFSIGNEFEKWAAIEVKNFDIIPNGMESFILRGGLYAVFIYRGPASKGNEIFQYIYGTWLPTSNYVLDDKPHFEILGEKYKNEDPDSKEEIWIPIKSKDVI